MQMRVIWYRNLRSGGKVTDMATFGHGHWRVILILFMSATNRVNNGEVKDISEYV